MRLFSPAKINLFLNVLSKRPDGYHELETLFERVSLGDDIVLTPKDSGISLTCTGDPAGRPYTKIPKGPTNLAWRAADLLRNQLQLKKGVHIRIKKRIPVCAGLGGGSSNAATVLLGLNRLWKLKLSKKKLLELGSRLGSDVPFFILDVPYALARGRGERLKKVRGPKGPLWHCLVKPPFGISTTQAYQSLWRHFLTPQKVDVNMLFRSLQKGGSEPLSKLLTNSLELTVNKRVTEIFKIKERLLLEGAFASLMSGSGSAVFGLFCSKKEAVRAASRLRKKNKRWQVFVASTY